MAKAAGSPYTDTQFQRLKRVHTALINNGLPGFKIKGKKNPHPLFSDFSERTFYSVMDTLKDLAREQGGEISFNHTLNRYECSRRFSLYLALFPDEKTLVTDMAAAMDWVGRLNDFAGLDDVFLKLEDRAGVVGRAKKAVIQYEQNPAYSGNSWLKPLYEAIQKKHPILLDYKGFEAESPTRYEVSPYLLREYNNRWFLFGWAEGWFAGRPFPLDRIEHIVPLPNKRQRPDETDWDTEFIDVIGVTRMAENPVETLVLRVWLPRARYVATKPLHQSQTSIAQTTTFVDFRYRLRWNPELVAKILEFGPDAELLSPPDRRAELAGKVTQMVERYGCGTGV